MKTVSKEELVERLMQNKELKANDLASKAQANRVVAALLDTVVDAVKNGEAVSLVNFGTFKPATAAATRRKNIMTGKYYDVAEKTVPRFKAGKGFKEAVNK